MAVLARLLIGSQQRVDLADFLSIQSYVASDFKELIKSFIGSRPIVLKGFEIVNAPDSIGTNSVSIKIADSVLYDPTSSAGSFYSGLPEGSELSQPIVLGQELRAGTSTTSVTNYVYLTLTTEGAAQDTRAFWDVDLNGGEGGEFNQTINTEAVISIQAGVSTSGFPQGSIPLAKVVYGTSIQEITDCRNMMFRLGTGGTSPDPNARYQFPPLPSSAYSRNEPPSTINSAALPSPFFGGDKNIQTLKDWMDVVMTKLAELSGTTYWYESTGDLSLVNVYDDALGSSLKSKGQWKHDEATVGSVEWTEDIIYRKMNDPRDIIVRSGTKLLDNEQVMWVQLVRNQKINELDLPVQFTQNSQIVRSSSDTETGRFSNLKLGDWIKAKGDRENLYSRVVGFYTDINASTPTTTPSNAISIKLEFPYNGAGGLSNAVYTKGVFDNSEVTVSDRDDSSLYEAGGNLYWLASRSDTIQTISNIDVQYRQSVTIDEADGKSAKIIFSASHGLLNGDRVVVSGGTPFDGTYEVEKVSSTEVSIQTTVTGTTSSANVGWMIVTTGVRTPSGSSFVIESANHGFASGQKVKMTGITPSTPVDINDEYILNIRSDTEFQIPYNGDQDISGTLTLNDAKVSCAKVILKTALGAIEVVQGETVDINEPDTANILDFIGMESLAEINPIYGIPSDSNNNMLSGAVNYNSSSTDSLKDRASRLTAMMADRVQDRDLKILGRTSFRSIIETGIDSVIVAGNSLTLNKPGSFSQIINLSSSYDIQTNQALIVDLDRNSDATISPQVVDFNSNFKLEENRLVLLRRDSSNNLYSWDGSKITPGASWTSNDTESAQNKNIMMQERVSVTYDGSSLLEFVSAIGYNYIKIPGSSDNLIDVSAFTSGIPITDGQSIWIRINRRVQKTFNNYKTDINYVDDDSNGTMYVCDTDLVPVDQDVVVLYSADASVLIRHLFNPPPSQNIYEEYFTLTENVLINGSLQLPLDSRNSNNDQRYYITGSGQLEVFLNGQKLKLNEDYQEIGSPGEIKSSIIVKSDFLIGDEVCFRIASEGAVYTVDLGTTTTLQQAYDQGRNVNVLDSSPINITANPGQDALMLNGDLRLNGLLGGFTNITGEVGPTGIEFLPMASSPLDASRSGIWIRDDKHLIQQRPGEAVSAIDLTESILNPESFLTGGDGIDITVDTISVDLAPDSGLEIDTEKLRVATSANGPIIRNPDGLDVKLEAANTSLEVVSNELGVKVDPAGAVLKNTDGVGVSVDNVTIQIVDNELVVSGVPNLLATFTNNSGADILKGSIVAASSTAEEIILASAATLSDASKIVGVAFADILDGESGQVQTAGITEVGVGLTIGSPVYLSATVPGQATQTKPSVYGNALVILGVATSATDIAWKPNKVSVVSNVYLESYETVDVTGVAEETTVTFSQSGDFYTGSTGKYWRLNSANDATSYYVWYNASDVTTSSDPVPAGTGIQVDIVSTDSASDISSKIAQAIDAVGDFNAASSTVEITNAATGTTTDAADVDAGVAILITTDGDVSTAEVAEISITLDGAGLDGVTGKYWTLNSANDATSYYVWYNVTDGSGTADPAPAGLTGIQVDVLLADTVEDVASKTADTIDLLADFDAVKLARVNIVNAAVGTATDAADFDTGFAITVTTDGDAVTAEETEIVISGDGSTLDGEIGKYFTINSANDATSYYVWFSVTNVSTPADPAPAGLTGIQIDINNTDSSTDIATKTATAIDLVSDFSVADNTGSITVTNAALGATTDALDVDASVSINVNTQGVTAKTGLDPNEIIDLPVDSRASNAVRQYSVGDALLTVWLNGVKQKEGEDYNEVGALGSLSNKVQIIDGSNAGDVWEFRIERDQALLNAINGL